MRLDYKGTALTCENQTAWLTTENSYRDVFPGPDKHCAYTSRWWRFVGLRKHVGGCTVTHAQIQSDSDLRHGTRTNGIAHVHN